MSLPVLSMTLGAFILLRVGFIALQLRDLGSFWYDLEHHGIRFQIARAISVVTWLVFFGCACYTLWTVKSLPAFWPRYGTVFVAWFGLALLARFPLHKFPRTNDPQLYSEAQVNLIVNLVMSLL